MLEIHEVSSMRFLLDQMVIRVKWPGGKVGGCLSNVSILPTHGRRPSDSL